MIMKIRKVMMEISLPSINNNHDNNYDNHNHNNSNESKS